MMAALKPSASGTSDSLMPPTPACRMRAATSSVPTRRDGNAGRCGLRRGEQGGAVRLGAEAGGAAPARCRGKLQAALGENADLGYSRLVSPRKLAPNTAYHAFVIPTFESGRRAGLNLDLADVAATMSAWDSGARPQGQSFPYYHRWYFRTGTTGDFETLVRLLVPKPVNPRVGVRERLADPGLELLDRRPLGGSA
jgi:hypothetical protein